MIRPPSAPPFSRHDVDKHFDITTYQDKSFELNMSPRDMSVYRVVREIYSAPSGRVMVLEGGKILKLRPMYVDVVVIVRNMRRAATVINVPKVYDYGYSGNCTFILMAHIYPAACLKVVMKGHEGWVFKYLEPQVEMIVRKLAGIGLSHNDLYPRNIMVGRDWDIVAVLDWDESGPLHLSREYSKRVCWNEDTHHWDHIFRAYDDPFASLDLVHDQNIYLHAPLIRSPPGRVIGPLTDELDFDATCGRESALKESQNRGGSEIDEGGGMIQYPVRFYDTEQRAYP